ncbi:MAG: Hsp20/alpha crystallin family protein [Gammaproteobacteria bacterium]|nr:Hsp20/alpha crystallin family protein [Gammaproteobacteria bacterium]NIR84796.1 Hsp20/alpha crystallin family protein [Gammaproteobacteria bacterium]NIR91510.1 Hsp20/alpha crystallin family protein [Gammaproteobacteria bacterium]NIU05843.1 Hsp20/alpha crystallin family protein [Gammaproteobacteria bacterium]NIV76698.1 Hsp20 family protein [Gammaproteobacteria bacterium]
MADLMRYEPWNVLQRMHSDLGRLFDETRTWPEQDASSVVTSHWAPAVDIREEDDRFVLTADVPGVEPKDIDLLMEDGMLVIKGERRWSDEERRESYRRVERSYGVFYRRFALPDNANPEGIQAKSRDGVLEVTIPKQEKEQPRRITVAS